MLSFFFPRLEFPSSAEGRRLFSFNTSPEDDGIFSLFSPEGFSCVIYSNPFFPSPPEGSFPEDTIRLFKYVKLLTERVRWG